MNDDCDWVEPPPLSVFTVQDQPVYACCYDHSEAPMTVTQLAPTSSTPKAIAHFTREGTTDTCGSRATLKLSRFENVLDHSRSQLDLVLAHDNYNDVDVMNLKSNGDVNVPGSLTVGGTAVALETDIPTTTDIVNNTSVLGVCEFWFDSRGVCDKHHRWCKLSFYNSTWGYWSSRYSR
jgi:hypothetical protein